MTAYISQRATIVVAMNQALRRRQIAGPGRDQCATTDCTAVGRFVRVQCSLGCDDAYTCRELRDLEIVIKTTDYRSEMRDFPVC